jgi:hypothetical protein
VGKRPHQFWRSCSALIARESVGFRRNSSLIGVAGVKLFLLLLA